MTVHPYDQQNLLPLSNYSIFPKNSIVYVRDYMEKENKEKEKEENVQFNKENIKTQEMKMIE